MWKAVESKGGGGESGWIVRMGRGVLRLIG